MSRSLKIPVRCFSGVLGGFGYQNRSMGEPRVRVSNRETDCVHLTSLKPVRGNRKNSGISAQRRICYAYYKKGDEKPKSIHPFALSKIAILSMSSMQTLSQLFFKRTRIEKAI